MEKNMKIQTCKFLINTLNETAKQNKISVTPKINSKYIRKLKKSEFNPYTGEIILNNIFNTNTKILKPIIKKSIQHNIKHAEQFQIIARYFAGVAQNIDTGIENFKNLLLEKFPQYESLNFNKKYYQKVIKQNGTIKLGNNLFEKAKIYIKALKEYPTFEPFENVKICAEEGFDEMILNKINKKKLKANNLLETEAKNATKQRTNAG